MDTRSSGSEAPGHEFFSGATNAPLGSRPPAAPIRDSSTARSSWARAQRQVEEVAQDHEAVLIPLTALGLSVARSGQ